MSDCIFCKIANREIPSVSLYEDEDFNVILDLSPATKGHALILPKGHFEDVCSLDSHYASRILLVAAKVGTAMKEALGCSGFNLVQNNGASAGQTVYHFHMHVIPRYDGGPDMVNWEPGSASPEELGTVGESIRRAMPS